MVAALGTSGKCHVWSVQTEPLFSFRILSAGAEKLVVSKSTLAIIWPPTFVGNERIAEGTSFSGDIRYFSPTIGLTIHLAQITGQSYPTYATEAHDPNSTYADLDYADFVMLKQ